MATAWHKGSPNRCGGGVLGYYYSKFLLTYYKELKLEALHLADVKPIQNIFALSPSEQNVKVINCDLSNTQTWPFDPGSYDVIINLASFASPVAYRANPKGTLKGSVLPVWHLLDSFSSRTSNSSSFQIFSSFEIYGDPPSDQIPTNEDYWGNFSCLGPRACYDESKRFVETLGSVFANEENINVSIVRPFNNFGPGMSLNDGRLPADVMRAFMRNQELTIFSDGKPTRSFCYIVDAIVGYLLAFNRLQYRK